MEQTSFAIDSVKDTQTTVLAMQAASKQLKIEHKKMNIGEIEDMQDDLTGASLPLSLSLSLSRTITRNDAAALRMPHNKSDKISLYLIC